MFTTLRCTKFLTSPSTPQQLFKSSSPKGGKSPLLSLPLSIDGSLLSYKDIPLPSKQHLEDGPATVDHLLLLSYFSNVNLSLSIFTPLLALWGVLNLSIPFQQGVTLDDTFHSFRLACLDAEPSVLLPIWLGKLKFLTGQQNTMLAQIPNMHLTRHNNDHYLACSITERFS